MSSAAVSPAGAARCQPLARPLHRGHLADRPTGSRRGGTRVEEGWSGHRCSPLRRRAGSPRTRTTEARRFLPPSGPGNTTNPSGDPLPPAHPGLHRGSTGRVGQDGAATEREVGERDQHAVEGSVEPDRCPDRPPRLEQPAEREARPGSGRRTRRPRARSAWSVAAPPTSMTWTMAKNRPPWMTARRDAVRRAARRSSRRRGRGSPRRSATITAPPRRLRSSPSTRPGRRQRRIRDGADEAARGSS